MCTLVMNAKNHFLKTFKCWRQRVSEPKVLQNLKTIKLKENSKTKSTFSNQKKNTYVWIWHSRHSFLSLVITNSCIYRYEMTQIEVLWVFIKLLIKEFIHLCFLVYRKWQLAELLFSSAIWNFVKRKFCISYNFA